jgi:flavodoxin
MFMFLILFSSKNNSTKKIAEKISEKLIYKNVIKNVNDLKDTSIYAHYKYIFLCSPTYGSEELHIDMESFIVKNKNFFNNKRLCLIETGNFYGYENFSFGAGVNMYNFFIKIPCMFFYKNLSLDTFPKTDYFTLNRWLNGLNVFLENHA